ncbi:MAG: SIMPL domain-containing protein [Anaerolineae bacterium]
MLCKESKVVVLGSLLLLAALLVSGCTTSAAAPPLAPQESNGADSTPRLLNVNGTGIATAAPDIVYVELGVDVKSTSASEAVAQSTDLMTRVMEAIKALEVEDKDIRTVAYNIWVEDEFDKEGKPTGRRIYHVVNRVQVTLRNLEKVGTLLEDALEAGANTVGGIRFSVEDPTALQHQARDAAIANARAKAEQLAKGLGVTLGEPYSISEYSGGGVPVERVMLEAPRFAAGEAAPVPVSPGELSITVEISVAWSIQ